MATENKYEPRDVVLAAAENKPADVKAALSGLIADRAREIVDGMWPDAAAELFGSPAE